MAACATPVLGSLAAHVLSSLGTPAPPHIHQPGLTPPAISLFSAVLEANLPWRGRHIPATHTRVLLSHLALSTGKLSAHIQRGLLASTRLGKGQCYLVFDKGLKSKTGAKEVEWEGWESGHHDSGQLEVL